MHDIGQIQTEYDSPEFEALDFEVAEESGGESPDSPDSTEAAPFSEEEEMALAAELLEVQDEAQLEEFLGKLVRRAVRTVRNFAATPVGKRLVGVLRGAAKRALPILGTAAGGMLGGPAGAALGGKLAAGAGQIFGLELEGLSPEDQEYEVARRYVRFAGAAARTTAAGGTNAPPAAAIAGATAAARRHAPGYLRGGGPGARPQVGQGRTCRCRSPRGQWFRRGRYIVVVT
jgi:hypothetical protein